MSVGRALGTICLLADSIPRKATPKLGSVEPASKEGFYMLAAYCFNLARKMEYVFKATREFAREGDPTLAREIKTTGEQIYGHPQASWKEIAEKEEAALLHLYKEIGEEHEKVLEQVAGQGR